MSIVIACLLAGIGVIPAGAQPAGDTLFAEPVPVAVFDDARALATDPFGRLYVADAGRDVVVQLAPSGLVLATLGGPGSGDGEFHDPSDVDPTNGLLLLVADAGNGRIQRFSRELAHLGSIRVRGSQSMTGSSWSGATFSDGARGADADGRPVAVVSAGTREVFAIDADRHVVLRWDQNLRLTREIGGQDAGEGMLLDPVAVAVDDTRSLFVADRGRRAVLVFDLFGSYVRALGEGLLDDLRALVVQGRQLWVVQGHRISVYGTDGGLERTITPALDAPLVDLAFHPAGIFLLTSRGLYLSR